MNILSTAKRHLNFVFLVFLFVAFLIGIAGALQSPTLSRFLTEEVHQPPFYVGLFYAVNALVASCVSFVMALYSDRKGDRRSLILFCCIMAMANAILFAYVRHYLVLISLGVLLAAFTNCIMPQLFALAREYADNTAKDVVIFSSIMRAQLSLAWVIGPPLAFYLSGHFGFEVMYLSAASVFIFSFIVIRLFLPSQPRAFVPSVKRRSLLSSLTDRHIMLLFISSTLMWGCNMMYLIDMPIYTVHELGLHSDLAGYLMGIAAGLEIPIMIIAGLLAKRFGKWRMMVFGITAGCLFYTGLFFFETHVALIFLQLLNATFIGIIAGIGMLYFQDLLPKQPGEATTLFTNSTTIGVILAGIIQGSLTNYVAHHWVYLAALIMSIISLILFIFVRKV